MRITLNDRLKWSSSAWDWQQADSAKKALFGCCSNGSFEGGMEIKSDKNHPRMAAVNGHHLLGASSKLRTHRVYFRKLFV
jgi:hypothetical protein